MPNILIIGNVLDENTYNYFLNPSIDSIFVINDLTLRHLNMYKCLKKNHSVKLIFREKTFESDINDTDILFFPHIMDAFYKVKDIGLIITNVYDYQIYQDLLLLDHPFIVDYGGEYNISYQSQSLKYKKYVHEHTQTMMSSILNKASAICYCHPNQRILALYELSKRFINNSINGKKLIYAGFGVTGKDDFNVRDGVLNCIFADMYTTDSNIDILKKALGMMGIRADLNKIEIFKDTIGVNLYNYNSFSSFVYFPFKTIEFASYGHPVIIDDNLAKFLNHYKSLIYVSNSSNINKLIKMIEYAKNNKIEKEVLEQFRYKYSWENQFGNFISYVDMMMNKRKIIIKKIKIKENKNERSEQGQQVHAGEV